MIFGHFMLVVIVYFMSGFNSHQRPAVPAAVIACCQRYWSYRLGKNALFIRIEIRMFDKFDLRSLYGCATQLILQIGNRQVCITFQIPGDERKGLFGIWTASLCHRNSKKLVAKSCRKFTFLPKSQNSPEIQAKRKNHADHRGNDTFACFIHHGKSK